MLNDADQTGEKRGPPAHLPQLRFFSLETRITGTHIMHCFSQCIHPSPTSTILAVSAYHLYNYVANDFLSLSLLSEKVRCIYFP